MTIDAKNIDYTSDEDIKAMSMLFQMLADPTRLKILNELFKKELCVSDLAEILQMTTSAISHQLANLKMTKLVISRKEGKNVYYSMADEHIKNIYAMAHDHVKEQE